MPLFICAFKHSDVHIVHIVHCLLIYHVTHMPMTVTSMHISLFFLFIFFLHFSSSPSLLFSPLCVLNGFAFHLLNKLYVLIETSPFSTLHVHFMKNWFKWRFFFSHFEQMISKMSDHWRRCGKQSIVLPLH